MTNKHGVNLLLKQFVNKLGKTWVNAHFHKIYMYIKFPFLYKARFICENFLFL